jgi:hypothetical protein
MAITLTVEEFNELAKYIGPERLDTFLMKHYKKNKYTIEPEIIASPYVTKQMTSKLFAESFPGDLGSMHAFLEKCSADELLLDFVNNTQATDLCWGEPVVKDGAGAYVISKALSTMCALPSYKPHYNEILNKFINAEIVTVDDIKLLLQNPFTHNSDKTKRILDCAQAKYSLDILLENVTIQDMQMLAEGCEDDWRYKELHTKLMQIIESKESAALGLVTSDGPADGYYSPGDDVPATGVVADDDDVRAS